jgi:hypothetical protein
LAPSTAAAIASGVSTGRRATSRPSMGEMQIWSVMSVHSSSRPRAMRRAGIVFQKGMRRLERRRRAQMISK